MIGLFYGTRPEYIKILPLILEFERNNIPNKVFQVRQHTDLLSGCLVDEFISVGDEGCGRLNSIVASLLPHNFTNLSHVLVQGDTSTAMAIALNAFNTGVKVIHLEAGLRTYDKDNPYPEEVNRRIISSLASRHYCPTEGDKQNLVNEGIIPSDIVVTGNTVLDSLVGITPSRGNEVLVTLHRRENLENIPDWFRAIEELAMEYLEYSFIFPMHPNPKVQEHKNLLKKVQVCDPIDPYDMKERIASCALTITDSGGIQEESSFFRKVCLVCRVATERPSEFGILCPHPKVLKDAFKTYHKYKVTAECPFGDGYAAKRITEDILSHI
jgi:UDP-N-acetylglucosamine 2-epimerase (non-hydrolysing)